MRLVITGAAGFVGRALVRHLQEAGFTDEVRLVDREFDGSEPFETLALDLSEPGAGAEAVKGADCVVHLAALPGGEAQRDPRASRRVNFDVPLDLIRNLDGRRLIYASSIAVLGMEFPKGVNDITLANPDSVYGMHKRMVELAFADAVARGSIQGLALRLPGIVARPRSDEGFGSAFLSDVFHAVRDGTTYAAPVAPDATSWLMSARLCAANLLHAALASITEAEAINLPALRVPMGELVAELGRHGDTRGIRFAEQPEVRKVFGSYPPLAAARAARLGFVSDGDIASLVANAWQDAELAEGRGV